MNPLIMALLSRLPQMGASASRALGAFTSAPKWKQFTTLSPLALTPGAVRSGYSTNALPDLPPNPLQTRDRMPDPNIRFGSPDVLGEELDRARVSTPAERSGSSELPFETYQRLTGQKWTGGSSDPVRALLQELGVSAQPGSSEANMGLQRALMARSAAPTAPVSAQAHPALADLFQAPTASMPDLESITSDSLPAEALMNLPGTTQGMAMPEQVRRRFLGLF